MRYSGPKSASTCLPPLQSTPLNPTTRRGASRLTGIGGVRKGVPGLGIEGLPPRCTGDWADTVIALHRLAWEDTGLALHRQAWADTVLALHRLAGLGLEPPKVIEVGEANVRGLYTGRGTHHDGVVVHVYVGV